MRKDASDKTIVFSIPNNREESVRTILTTVYRSLEQKGYNPINQMVGYILSEDPTYITTHNNARSLISKIDRDDLLEILLKSYLDV
ncbi:MAG: IreB family regulatory phosphoprotein [Clostridia bacterium]|nr:IreB family regulatory phosphoprotein [Clostridia bacterium]